MTIEATRDVPRRRSTVQPIKAPSPTEGGLGGERSLLASGAIRRSRDRGRPSRSSPCRPPRLAIRRLRQRFRRRLRRRRRRPVCRILGFDVGLRHGRRGSWRRLRRHRAGGKIDGGRRWRAKLIGPCAVRCGPLGARVVRRRAAIMKSAVTRTGRPSPWPDATVDRTIGLRAKRLDAARRHHHPRRGRRAVTGRPHDRSVPPGSVSESGSLANRAWHSPAANLIGRNESGRRQANPTDDSQQVHSAHRSVPDGKVDRRHPRAKAAAQHLVSPLHRPAPARTAMATRSAIAAASPVNSTFRHATRSTRKNTGRATRGPNCPNTHSQGFFPVFLGLPIVPATTIVPMIEPVPASHLAWPLLWRCIAAPPVIPPRSPPPRRHA